MLFLANIIGCLFYLVHVLEIAKDPKRFTWLVHLKLDNTWWFEQYITGVYFAVITM